MRLNTPKVLWCDATSSSNSSPAEHNASSDGSFPGVEQDTKRKRSPKQKQRARHRNRKSNAASDNEIACAARSKKDRAGSVKEIEASSAPVTEVVQRAGEKEQRQYIRWCVSQLVDEWSTDGKVAWGVEKQEDIAVRAEASLETFLYRLSDRARDVTTMLHAKAVVAVITLIRSNLGDLFALGWCSHQTMINCVDMVHKDFMRSEVTELHKGLIGSAMFELMATVGTMKVNSAAAIRSSKETAKLVALCEALQHYAVNHDSKCSQSVDILREQLVRSESRELKI
jgi:hypothetical protein